MQGMRPTKNGGGGVRAGGEGGVHHFHFHFHPPLSGWPRMREKAFTRRVATPGPPTSSAACIHRCCHGVAHHKRINVKVGRRREH
jgi:hypothetical protein